jgi:hypothetical protein
LRIQRARRRRQGGPHDEEVDMDYQKMVEAEWMPAKTPNAYG